MKPMMEKENEMTEEEKTTMIMSEKKARQTRYTLKKAKKVLKKRR